MTRRLVIGDIHGGLKALQQVLQRGAITTEDQLVFLGDYVDGWSESAEVITFLLKMNETHDCIFIKGNHDLWCEEWLRTGEPNDTWLMHGGQETVRSYETVDAAGRLEHLNFLVTMPYYFIDESNRLFIHAGFTSMHGPQNEFHRSNFSWDRTLWEMALTIDERIKQDSLLFPKRLKLFNEIYIGHTPTLYYDVSIPMQGCNVWNVDTGAAFYGKLTIMDIASKEYWQSDPVQELYPGEVGRNKS